MIPASMNYPGNQELNPSGMKPNDIMNAGTAPQTVAPIAKPNRSNQVIEIDDNDENMQAHHVPDLAKP